MLLDVYLGLHSANEGEPVGEKFIPYYFPDEESLKFHVVGECQDCHFWSKDWMKVPPGGLPPEAIEDLKDTHRECEHEESPCLVTPKKYACVYFKKK